MTARKTPRFDFAIACGGWLVAALVSGAALFATPLQDASEQVIIEVRTVSKAAQPCLSLREMPSYRARIIGCIEIGSEVVVSGAENGWSRVSSSEGSGWVGTRLLDPPSPRPAPPPSTDGSSGSSATSDSGAEPAGGRARPRRNAEIERLKAERESLAGQLANAKGRIAVLESELTGMTLDNDAAELHEQTRAENEQLRAQLAEARQRAADLESELASTRAAWGSTAQEQSVLAERVAELTAERDSLASDLTRAEARQLYLQSDLGSTRAELMQLKGIPPKLVMPEPEPVAAAPPPADPEPEALEPSDGAETGLAPELRTEAYQAEEVVAAVRAWAQAWASQRVDDYLSFYAPSFRPAEGQERSAWERMRRERVSAPRLIEVSLDRISPTVSGNRAIVLFEQTYRSDNFNDTVDKTLVMELIDGFWRIVEERVNE